MRVLLVLFASNVAKSFRDYLMELNYEVDRPAVDLVRANGHLARFGAPECVLVSSIGSTEGLSPEQSMRARIDGATLLSGTIWTLEELLEKYPQLAGRVILMHSLKADDPKEAPWLEKIENDPMIHAVYMDASRDSDEKLEALFEEIAAMPKMEAGG